MNSLEIAAKFARRLIDKHSLKAPVDIESLIKEYADVEFKEFPSNLNCFDGVTLNLKKLGERPKVFINSIQPSTRTKFTLAHELGHIIIPWHTGNIVDNISSNLHEHNEYTICETEANEFASEILLPSEWIISLLDGVNSIDKLKLQIEYIEKITHLSHSAIAYKVIRYLNPGFVFVVTNDDYIIRWSKHSESTRNKLMFEDKGKSLLHTTFYKNYNSREYTVEVYGLKYFWYYTNDDFYIEYNKTDTRTDNEILRAIVKDFGLNSKSITSISSATAFSKGKFKENTLTFDNLIRACYEKLQDEKYKWILEHPDCNTYIYKRVLKFLAN